MKILLLHNYYQQPGGEDQVFADEGRLLESHGHTVVRYTRHNDDIQELGQLTLARQTIWNRETYRVLRQLIEQERPDVMHCHNTFPLISPSAYSAAKACRVPVVQALHNYRLLCPGALLERDGRVCEDCLGKKLAWRAVLHRCYRDSRAASTLVTALIASQRVRGFWRNVNLFYCMTQFARQKYIDGGMPAERLAVKPNFVSPDPSPGEGRGGYVLFAGRLSPEKGLDVLLNAWRMSQRRTGLRIVGDGPLAPQVQAAAEADPSIQWLGRLPVSQVLEQMGAAAALIMPSIWYEGFPKTVVESLAKGTPVIGSKLGALGEAIIDRHNGRHFEAGNANDLAAKLDESLADPEYLAGMRAAARTDYETLYTPDVNYRHLLSLYRQAGVNVPESDTETPELIAAPAGVTV